jgi:hypothetical protein
MSSQTEPTKGDTYTHLDIRLNSVLLIGISLSCWCSIQRAQYATDAAAAGADAVEPIQSGVTNTIFVFHLCILVQLANSFT